MKTYIIRMYEDQYCKDYFESKLDLRYIKASCELMFNHSKINRIVVSEK